MTSIGKRWVRYWNQPIHEPTAKARADLEAVEQLLAELEAIERETGKCIICELPEFGCGF